MSIEENEKIAAIERGRAMRQQKSVFVLSAAVLGRPYDTPPYIPVALTALSKHSFENKASLSVREVVKMVCSEFKKTHTDNWEAHRAQFTQEQLEALEDVVRLHIIMLSFKISKRFNTYYPTRCDGVVCNFCPIAPSYPYPVPSLLHVPFPSECTSQRVVHC